MIRIAIADCPKYAFYEDWLFRLGHSTECVRLSYQKDNLADLQRCDGLLLTGGGDVHIDLYRERIHANASKDSRSGNIIKETLMAEERLLKHVDSRRDSFEMKVIEETLRVDLPILGICRGLQIANVYFGGTLVRDLGAKNKVHAKENDLYKRHMITVDHGTLLEQITGKSVGEVNSSHHQAVEIIGPSLTGAARSDDGVIEALEMREALRNHFFLLVQWHPEKMEDVDNPFCMKIGRAFISSIKGR